jgi:hypothetical protein
LILLLPPVTGLVVDPTLQQTAGTVSSMASSLCGPRLWFQDSVRESWLMPTLLTCSIYDLIFALTTLD